MIEELIKKNRSYRRFYEQGKIEESVLKELINLARFSPSASNLQPLKYMLSCAQEKNDLIFPALAWAGYLKGWPGPKQGERPAAYIIILGDKKISTTLWCDCGIAAQSIMLAVTEKGYAGCIIGSIQREFLRKNLNIPQHLEILLVLAMGRPKEIVLLEDKKPDTDIKYYRDEKGNHHVPKRTLKEIIVA
ncbi:MAG: nitroreductase family protein [Candidatus Omnitrophota bacterium]